MYKKTNGMSTYYSKKMSTYNCTVFCLWTWIATTNLGNEEVERRKMDRDVVEVDKET